MVGVIDSDKLSPDEQRTLENANKARQRADHYVKLSRNSTLHPDEDRKFTDRIYEIGLLIAENSRSDGPNLLRVLQVAVLVSENRSNDLARAQEGINSKLLRQTGLGPDAPGEHSYRRINRRRLTTIERMLKRHKMTVRSSSLSLSN